MSVDALSHLDLTALQTRLTRYREMTLQELLAVLPTREPKRYLYDPLKAHLSRMGKGIRPALCIATCRAFGGTEEQALKSAVALEMIHNAFLVHDDVEDGSEYRRTQPTMQTEHGIPIAVNAGDAMNALSLRLVRENFSLLGPELTQKIFAEFDHLMLQSLEGQALELGWVRDNCCEVTEADYLRMILKKTCWYSFMHPCRIGALIAQGDAIDLDQFNRFGYYMGSAFQIQDDVLNLVGDSDKYGKEIGGDLWEGKRTLMLAHLFKSATEVEGDRLRTFLGLPRLARSPEEVAWAIERMHHYGSIDYASSVARHFADSALSEFEIAYADAPASEEKAFIPQLIRYMVSRNL
ncbi:MAG: polyprenyl synthetase family protein [Thermosynechococcaceae cyanobacterium]